MFEHAAQLDFNRLEMYMKLLECRINRIEDGLQPMAKRTNGIDEHFVQMNLSELRMTLEDSMRNLEALERRLKI